MNNLFSIFDPVSLLGLPLNWFAAALALVFIPCRFWVSPSQSLTFTQNITHGLKSEFTSVLGGNANPGIVWVIISILLFIAVNNFMGLFPYVFTASSHLLFTLPLSLILWVGFFTMKAFKQPLSMLSHFLPLGTPYALMPLMVLIEVVSNLIRPVTLAVRLAANMVAGHLLLTLLSSLSPSAPSYLLVVILSALILLLVLESAVALIQSYVFSILTTLYVEEVESFKMNLHKM